MPSKLDSIRMLKRQIEGLPPAASLAIGPIYPRNKATRAEQKWTAKFNETIAGRKWRAGDDLSAFDAMITFAQPTTERASNG